MDARIKKPQHGKSGWPLLKFGAEFFIAYESFKNIHMRKCGDTQEWQLSSRDIKGVASLLGFENEASAEAIENTREFIEDAMRSAARKSMPAGMSMRVSRNGPSTTSASGARGNDADSFQKEAAASASHSLNNLFERLSNFMSIADRGRTELAGNDEALDISQPRDEQGGAGFGGALLVWPPRADTVSPCIALCIEPSAWRKASRSLLGSLVENLAMPAARSFILSSQGQSLSLGPMISATLNSCQRHAWACVETRSTAAAELGKTLAAAESFYGVGAIWAAHVVPQAMASTWDRELPDIMSALLERDELAENVQPNARCGARRM